jgi:hypothetical protein
MPVPQHLEIDRKILARSHSLSALLQPEARAKLDAVAKELLVHLMSGSADADPSDLVQKELRRRFARLSSDQCNLLSFYVLAEVVSRLSKSMKPGSELKPLRLQIARDTISKLTQLLSNIMKETSDTLDSIIQNLR